MKHPSCDMIPYREGSVFGESQQSRSSWKRTDETVVSSSIPCGYANQNETPWSHNCRRQPYSLIDCNIIIMLVLVASFLTRSFWITVPQPRSQQPAPPMVASILVATQYTIYNIKGPCWLQSWRLQVKTARKRLCDVKASTEVTFFRWYAFLLWVRLSNMNATLKPCQCSGTCAFIRKLRVFV